MGLLGPEVESGVGAQATRNMQEQQRKQRIENKDNR
jgi:hypothetical protein